MDGQTDFTVCINNAKLTRCKNPEVIGLTLSSFMDVQCIGETTKVD